MKIQHKVNHGWLRDRTDPGWANRVERESATTTEQAARTANKAADRLARAQVKAEREERRTKPDLKKVARLWTIVATRREELLALERLAQSSPAGSQNRGQGSYRGVPGTRPL